VVLAYRGRVVDRDGSETADAADLSTPGGPSADPLDAVLKQAIAAPEVVPVVAGTTIAGRYVVERVLGSGGMGTVYLARDRSLDRAVALKLHRSSAASERLHREAIAMAKLAHPNVVTVFEVGELDGRPFVAMEYVAGSTLRAWLAAERRGWRAIVGSLRAVGEGLAAVHDAGLVHRDVKPDNVLVGDDGRIRLGDFGLALLPQGSALGSGGLDPAMIATNTATGTVLGTPAYMAPEQIEGREIDARTDQFAFCVAAWEAMCGDRPYRGTTAEELRTAIVRGEPAPPAKGGVPARIRRVLKRGMAADPAARWPSMRALLAALRSAERRPRVVAGASAGVLAAAIAVWALWPAKDPAAACGDVGGEIELLLPASFTEAAVAAARRGGRANGDAEARRIAEAVDRYRAAYRQTVQTGCRARERKQWSPELVAASAECATYLTVTARELLVAAPASATQPSDVLQIVDHLPSLAPCGDARELATWRPLATGPDAADAIAARARLEAAMVLIDFAQVAVARATRDAIASSPVRANPAVARRFDLLRGEILVAESKLADAEPVLADVYYASRAQDDGPLALVAATDLIDLSGRVRRDHAAADRWIRDGIAEAERQRALAPRQAFDLLIAAGRVLADADQPARALELAQRAEALHAETDANRIELLRLRAEALAQQGKLPDALATIDDAIGKLKQLVGPQHPKVAEALARKTSFLLDADKHEEAVAPAREAVAILAGAGADTSRIVAIAEMDLGAALLGMNDPTASEHLEKARAMIVAMYGELHADVALLDTNRALVYLDRKEVGKGLELLRHATAIQEQLLGADHQQLADGLYNLAVAERQAGKLDDAVRTAQRCVAIFDKHKPGSVRHAAALGHVAMIENMRGHHGDAIAAADRALGLAHVEESPGISAWARLEKARALIALHRDPAAARTLLGEARTRYAAAKLPARLTEIDGLLAQIR
jgi:eukaryotic-like serine/threonine-protein kinase